MTVANDKTTIEALNEDGTLERVEIHFGADGLIPVVVQEAPTLAVLLSRLRQNHDDIRGLISSRHHRARSPMLRSSYVSTAATTPACAPGYPSSKSSTNPATASSSTTAHPRTHTQAKAQT